MITKKNLKFLLDTIGFSLTEGGVYSKSYDGLLDCRISVDFAKEAIIWPDGLRRGDDTTSNFSSPENFVVLECVDRLLEKGYRPEHIVLEEKWLLGHEQKGGKADICVYAPDNSLLVIIECKTAGEEFRKFKKQLFSDGGQLFSYWQQDRSAKWLCLYASDLVESCDGGTVSRSVEYENSIVVVNCSDDPNMEKTAESDDSVHLYSHAHSAEQLFEVWDVTYNKQTCPDVIFGKDSQAYKIGIRRLHKRDLRSFSREDGIVNRFEEILRHNNVSDKENAFNKLVSLFICKLVDEITKGEDDELDFQYRVGSDDYESLQDRLQRLHRDGMLQFMNEKIFYVENDYADRLFSQYSKSNRINAIQDLRSTIRKLKFYSNNEFAFKDVHNEGLFLQNSKILVEMVQLFEPYRIVYPARDQLLGDLFEQLLAKGFKQNEGQFFTAMPLTRFIWESLPLDTVIRRGGKLFHPRIIDYACGAGHFLTEGVEAINAYFKDECGKEVKDNSWVEKFVYGVEKDYRLARVSKVSLHMNGAGAGQIVFGDGLENYPDKGIEPGRFGILVANPPYAVDAFKAHLRLRNNTLDLLESITDQGSEIEALFVERTAQLLKPRGVAAIILPASILTGPGPYINAREQLIDNFKVRAIVALGKNAFQATSTETIILFLEKYDEPPRRAALVVDSVEAIISGKSLDGWEDKDIFEVYLRQIDVTEDDYSKFISRVPSWTEWREHEYFGMYAKAFSSLSDVKSLATKAWFKKLDAPQQDAELTSRFYEWCLGTGGVERDKLVIFGLVYGQKTLIVKSPDDKNEERKFLGYSWSNRRGQEGIQIETPGGMLYDDTNRRADATIAAGIRQSFADEPPQIADGEAYTRYVSLKDLIDFSRPKFDKAIGLSPRRFGKPPKGFVYLETVAEYASARIHFGKIKSEEYITTDNMLPSRGGIAAYKGDPISGTVVAYRKGDTLVSNIRPYLKKIWLSDRDGGCSPDVLVIRSKDTAKCLPEYLNVCLSLDEFFSFAMDGKTGLKMPRGDKEAMMRYPIPLPDIATQKKIVDACGKVDSASAKQRNAIAEAREKITEAFSTGDEKAKTEYKLSNEGIFSLQIGKRVVATEVSEKYEIPVFSANIREPFGNIDKVLDSVSDFSVPSVLWGIDGDWDVGYVNPDRKFYPTDHCGVLRVKTNEIVPKYLVHALFVAGSAAGFKRSYRASIDRVASLKIAVPPLAEQRRIVAEVEKCEREIAAAEARLASATADKFAILSKLCAELVEKGN